MAYEKGTATNVADLLLKLETFLTTNPALVAAGQQWESIKDNTISPYTTSYDITTGGGYILPRFFKGKGLDGLDEIHVSMQIYYDKNLDTYNVLSYPNKNYDKTKAVDAQYGTDGRYVAFSSWSTTLQYWFIANGRRFIVITKVANRYTSMYAGFILPSGTDLEYPYPLFVGGNHSDIINKYNTDDYNNIRSFFNPAKSNSSYVKSSLMGFIPNYEPIIIINNSQPAENTHGGYSFPYASKVGVSQYVGKAHNGEYVIENIELVQYNTVFNTLGWFDGVLYVTGYENSPENLIRVGADEYLCFPGMLQNDHNNFAAFKIN